MPTIKEDLVPNKLLMAIPDDTGTFTATAILLWSLATVERYTPKFGLVSTFERAVGSIIGMAMSFSKQGIRYRDLPTSPCPNIGERPPQEGACVDEGSMCAAVSTSTSSSPVAYPFAIIGSWRW